MGLPKVLTEVIKVEISLSNHCRAVAERAINPVLKPVLDLLAEESMLHATKLRCISETELEDPANSASAIDRIAVIGEKLGELVLQTDPHVLVVRGMKLEEMLRNFYRDLSESTAGLGEHNISPLLSAIASDEDYHWSLLDSARALLGQDLTPEEEI